LFLSFFFFFSSLGNFAFTYKMSLGQLLETWLVGGMYLSPINTYFHKHSKTYTNKQHADNFNEQKTIKYQRYRDFLALRNF
jgi:hypothetical protein